MNLPDSATKATLKRAQLHYADDSRPGVTRRKTSSGFVFIDKKGRIIRQASAIKRFRGLAIPPAYKEVWINPDPKGHIQAVGRDARGRKQYRYHPEWRAVRDSSSFERMIEFAKALPHIRRVSAQHMKLPGMPREKVLAAVVQLLEKTLIRIGNDEYARTNHSFGLTTLKNKHAKVRGSQIEFKFRGKHGIVHSIELSDPNIAKIVRKCQDLPGQEIFEYVDDGGARHDVKSDDVNEYLREVTGVEGFSAKDFRTWIGTLLAAEALREFKEFTSQNEAKKQVLEAIESVSKKLGNTKSICRKCDIHPVVLNSHLDGSFARHFKENASNLLRGEFKKLKPSEAAILVLLQKGL